MLSNTINHEIKISSHVQNIYHIYAKQKGIHLKVKHVRIQEQQSMIHVSKHKEYQSISA